MNNINALSILDQLDALRRRNDDAAYQHAMRMACAVVAKKAGYNGRNEWTDMLKADKTSKYAKDLLNPLITF